jgi:cytochrome c-type biogenesis protein CcmF
LVAGVAVSAALAVLGVHNVYALISFALCTFVAITVFVEFITGAGAIRSKSGTNLLAAMVELTHRNTRRYGGYLVHMGIVLMFIGFTGKAFDRAATVEVGTGESFQLGQYRLQVNGFQAGQNETYIWEKMQVAAWRGGNALGTLEPERRVYIASQQPTSDVAIRRRLNEDLYLNFGGMSADGKKGVVQAFVFPLVSWIWIGYWVVLFGTIICLIPSKSRLVYPRTEVVGIAGKHAKVED